jgi:hypothetical protein
VVERRALQVGTAIDVTRRYGRPRTETQLRDLTLLDGALARLALAALAQPDPAANPQRASG